ncbi:MAG: hypothetical protein DMD56_03415 [Gemmatimonadetes bacterium]|nr:MAG: hypothetical protein DMD56_03415 [Gemmatimonadota bacterium]
MTRTAGLLLFVAAASLQSTATAQQTSPYVAAQRAESLRLAGRPWHAAETLLAAAAREPRLNATFVVEGAKAELYARRYDRARSLLVGQPWLEDYADGAALAVLAEAEGRLGLATQAAAHYAAARARVRGSRAALLAVREGLAWEAAGARDSAAAAYGAARAAGLPAIDAWVRLRQARVTRDTAVAFRLLADLPAPAAREAASARAQALLSAGDSVAALEALAQAGRSLDLARLALAHGDSSRARDALYGLMARAPETDDAAAAVGVALAALPPRTPPERVALARAMKGHGGAADARLEVERALRQGDSSAATLVLAGELFTTAGRYRDAERAYRSAAADPVLGALAIYRRARVLVRLGDAGASEALSGFAQSFPSDTAAPTALYMLGDMLGDRGDWAGAARWFGELIARYPADLRASLARFRLAAQALRDGLRDSAAALFRAEVVAGGPQRTGLDTAAQAEVRALLGRAAQQDVDALLAWSDGLAARGFGPAAVRLGWQAALKSPNDSRVLRVIFPWPNRRAVEAEAAEFGVDPLLLVAIVRQESVFDAQALSPAGARGLAQLLPGTAALTARGLDVTFYPEWITVPDLNLHLGAAHLQELLQRFGGRVDAAAAAYNAGAAPVKGFLDNLSAACQIYRDRHGAGPGAPRPMCDSAGGRPNA